MNDMARGLSPSLAAYGKNQDLIGRRHLMEGMVGIGCKEIQAVHMWLLGVQGNASTWASELSIKLLECTHRQWLY